MHLVQFPGSRRLQIVRMTVDQIEEMGFTSISRTVEEGSIVPDLAHPVHAVS